MAKLTFVFEDSQEVEVPLKEHLTIGRDEDNDVVVDDERISPRHAELVRNSNGSFQVFDRDSGTGTFVNGGRVLSHTLQHDDKIAFGPLTGTLDLEEETAGAKPAPQTREGDSHEEALELADLEAKKKKLKSEVAALEKEHRDWQQRSEKERAMHSARVESLLAEEARLEPVKAAVEDAESAHREWLAAIETLSAQHADKTAALERLNTQHVDKATEFKRLSNEAETRQNELNSIESRLNEVRNECEQDEALLNSLRKQIIELESRLEEGRELAATREEQVKTAEKKIAQLEQLAQHLAGLEKRVEELSGSEEKLAAASALYQETDARHGELNATCSELESKRARLEADLKALDAQKAQRKHEIVDAETAVKKMRGDLDAETKRLEETRAARAGIERECQELADTKQKLADTRQRLAAVEQRLRDAQNATVGAVPHIATPKRNGSEPLQSQLDELNAKIAAAKQELASLEAKKNGPIQTAGTSHEAMMPAGAETKITAPLPEIVHVEAVRLEPVRMKSESTRVSSQAATPPGRKAKTKN